MSLENLSNYEITGLRERELPKAHLEGMDLSRLEGMNETDKKHLVGEHYFREVVETAPGNLDAFRELSKEGSKEEFASFYEQYVDNPRELERENPELYTYFKNRIFYGKEFGLSGMEKFIRDTAPRPAEQTVTAEKAADSRLPKTELHHGEILNCERPYSHGDITKMARKMDFIKGDTALLPIAPNRMVACRNLMALCGREFTEDDVISHAVDMEIVAYDPAYLKGFSHTSNDTFVPLIVRGMSGTEMEKPVFADTDDPAEAMAELLDQGHRGMVTYNSALLNLTDAECRSRSGKALF